MSHRTKVGFGKHYDRLGALQFGVLIDWGLTEDHTVLDVGCGPLRLGRILIPWLKSGRYHGIEPDKEAVGAALDWEVGRQLVQWKNPTFRFSKELPFGSFGHRFDFIIAHSVFIRMPMWQVSRCIAGAADVLEPTGRLLFSYKDGPTTKISKWGDEGPGHVTHDTADLVRTAEENNLATICIPTTRYQQKDFAHNWMICVPRT
jgi:SAM-dependent methyltransferase